jgi:DNA-binding GntR family transcriptional regulator
MRGPTKREGGHVRHIQGASSLTDQVVEAVREAVSGGELEPGRLYSVYQLAERLQVSRTPVREGLLRLAEAGMVQFERNRGFRILRSGPEDIADVFEVRALLEPPAARRAAGRVDDARCEEIAAALAAMRDAAAAHDEHRFMRHDRDFHDLVLTAGGNAKLAEIVAGLRDVTVTLGASTVDRSRSLDDIAAEHEPILDALRARDGAAAEAAMRAHVVHTGELLVAQARLEAAPPPGTAAARG